MLDAKMLAGRLADAMKEAGMGNAQLAAAITDATGKRVTRQAVGDWLKTGRLAKGRIPLLADLLDKPLGYFLKEDYMRQGGRTTIEELADDIGLTVEEIYAAASAAANQKQKMKARKTREKGAA